MGGGLLNLFDFIHVISSYQLSLLDEFRSMRIGKILVDSDSETHEARVVFAKFPDDIANR